MIRPLTNDDVGGALKIINEAARAYQGIIPADFWQEPYMSLDSLRAEIAAGVDFWTCQAEGDLLGVMGRQPLTDVTLIRHAYVRPSAQSQGIGARLLNHLLKG
ncbi:MAG: GNAT family N-acetyltransferase, partial [Desulfobaccales bacterium]